MLVPVIMMTSLPADRESTLSPTGPRSRQPPAFTAGRLSVAFTWAGDRWQHAVTIDGRPLATSLEHTADGRDPEWPASPPLVELSTASTGAGLAVLGVGRAGRSHYSASFTPLVAEPDTVLVEIACRVSEPPAWLGSTYVMAGRPVRIVAAPPETGPPVTVRWAYTAGPAGLFPLPPTATDTGR